MIIRIWVFIRQKLSLSNQTFAQCREILQTRQSATSGSHECAQANTELVVRRDREGAFPDQWGIPEPRQSVRHCPQEIIGAIAIEASSGYGYPVTDDNMKVSVEVWIR